MRVADAQARHVLAVVPARGLRRLRAGERAAWRTPETRILRAIVEAHP